MSNMMLQNNVQDDVEKREYHRNNEHRDSVARWDSGAQVFVVRTSVFLVYVADDAQANGVKANVVSDCHEVSSVIWNVLVVDSPKREQDACFDREEKRKSNRKYAHDEEEHELLFRQLAELRKCPHALPEKERKEPCQHIRLDVVHVVLDGGVARVRRVNPSNGDRAEDFVECLQELVFGLCPGELVHQFCVCDRKNDKPHDGEDDGENVQNKDNVHDRVCGSISFLGDGSVEREIVRMLSLVALCVFCLDFDVVKPVELQVGRQVAGVQIIFQFDHVANLSAIDHASDAADRIL